MMPANAGPLNPGHDVLHLIDGEWPDNFDVFAANLNHPIRSQP